MTQPADNAELRKLTRAQIQSLAKREGIRANGKTEEIIHRLIQKYPRGVPILEDASNPSASLAPLKPTLPPETTRVMDSPRLRELPRAQLQSLAKREGVRAAGKTVDIIRRLLRKHPGGVPVPKDVPLNPDAQAKSNLGNATNPRALPSAPERIVLRIPRKNTPSVSPVPRTSKVPPDLKGKGKQVVESTLSSTSVDLLYPDDEPKAGPSNTAQPPEVAEPYTAFSSGGYQDEGPQHRSALPTSSVPGWRADEEDEPEEVYDDIDYPKGAPSHYMVVDALRQFTTLVNNIPSMETRIAESQCLLQRAEAMLNKAIPDARELVVTREYLETFLLGKMKQKRELWDGTAKMSKQDRKLRTEWLRDERRTESEKRWREANELYRKHGLEPEPLSAFISESDEEVVASLLTTPTSSRDSSSKRSREKSVGGESEGDVGSDDDESRRKRARL